MDPHAPAPMRPVGAFKPLITAAEGFPEFERLAAGARRTLWLSFRVFDPTTRLRAETSAGETWVDLIGRVLDKGVAVRVLLSDFDPVGAPELHETTWRSIAALGRLGGRGSLEILPVRHEARVGRGLRLGLWLPAFAALDRLKRTLNGLDPAERAERLAHMPGLWRYLRLDRRGRIVWRAPRMPRLFPGTVHQKVAIADGTRAVIGGLDIDERRFDDPEHRRPSDQTWHDVSVTVDGPVVADIARHVAHIWNANRLRMAALRREQASSAPPSAPLMPEPVARLDVPDAPDGDGRADGVRLLRTLSEMRRRSFFRFSPRTVLSEIEDAHLRLIRGAAHSLYLETQFLRSVTIAAALAEAAERTPDLNLVLILPAAPEDVAFEDRARLAARMGEHLQHDCLARIAAAFGRRCAILSPARPRRSLSDRRDQLHGADIVYVHSKVTIADGREAIVGSANLNGRSLRWDTEAAVLCNAPDRVAGLIEAVLGHWLPAGGDARVLATPLDARCWMAHAEENAAKPPEERKGYLLPYDIAASRADGLPVPGVPDELV